MSITRDPAANPDTVYITEDAGKLSISTDLLLSNDGEPNGPPLNIFLLSFKSAAGATLTLEGDKIIYDPGNILQSLGLGNKVYDNFTYYNSDTDFPKQYAHVTVIGTGLNDAPLISSPLPDLALAIKRSFSYAIPANTVTDIDYGDSLVRTLTIADGGRVPAWLNLNQSGDVFVVSGTPPSNASGSIPLRFTATDLAGASVIDDFTLRIESASTGSDTNSSTSTDQARAESATNKTGVELLDQYLADIAKASLPFVSKIDLDKYLRETWQPFPYAHNVKYKATSAQGSSLALLNIASLGNGIETSGTELTFVGSDGARLANKYLAKQPQNSGYGPQTSSIALDWAYGSSNALASDDMKISLKISANDLLSAHPGGQKLSGASSFNILYEAGAGEVQMKGKGSDTYTVIMDGSGTISEINTANFTYFFTENSEEDTFKFSFSGTRTEDLAAGTMSFSWKSISAQIGKLKFTTKIYSGSTDVAISLSTLLDVDNAKDNLQNLWLPLIAQGNNSYAGGRESDIVDASNGNDTVSGNQGDDFLQGGKGYDQISGGAGADVFIFAAGDSDISDLTSDVIKDFKYADGDQIDLNNLANIQCQVSTVSGSSFNAALTAANQDLASGSNVSIQFAGKNAVLFADMNLDGAPDLAIRLVGIKAGDKQFADYAESGAMFTGGS